jgi:hypothetical protein
MNKDPHLHKNTFIQAKYHSKIKSFKHNSWSFLLDRLKTENGRVTTILYTTSPNNWKMHLQKGRLMIRSPLKMKKWAPFTQIALIITNHQGRVLDLKRNDPTKHTIRTQIDLKNLAVWEILVIFIRLNSSLVLMKVKGNQLARFSCNQKCSVKMILK